MPLDEYQAKRRFDSTPEPPGAHPGPGDGPLRFVVQKHDATRLHYDFRLELGGVLLSWAMPKGPSLNPTTKRLAMQVEDHPLEYGKFEGTIPEHNYGAGTVMVWDEGTYSDAEDSADPETAASNLQAGLAKGDLKFTLHGKKLHGSWVLVKTHTDDENSWLLIKHKDDAATAADVTAKDRSALSDRTMEEIARDPARWLPEPSLNLDGAPKAAQPATLAPMLAGLADQPFDKSGWLYELKWDGYRIMAHLQDRRVRLLTRNGEDYTNRFKVVADELANLRLDAILDGEMVVLDDAGRPDFGALQDFARTGHGDLVYYVFDLPFAAGRDLRELPLIRRRENLAKIVAPLTSVRISDHVEDQGEQLFRLAAQQNLEGIMAKSAGGPYRDGKRSRDWLKIKTHLRQEAVVGGYTEPRGTRDHLGALLLGLYDDTGNLNYVGSVGGGFTDQQLETIRRQLEPLEQTDSPFAEPVKTDTKAHWVQPKLLAEVTFAAWTADGKLRQPVFVGLRDDKSAADVGREHADGPPAPASPPPPTKATITNPGKVYWPDDHITKADLIAYYDQIADTILPYLKDRPESLNRHPGGITGGSFFQKDVEKHPAWVKTQAILSESNKKSVHWVIANDRDTLLYLANLGCIELNPWHSRTASLDRPDYCLLDIDAKSVGYEAVVTVATEAHRLLTELKIPAYPKTSGKTGLHICIPLGARYTYEQSKQFAQILMHLVHERLPELTSVERSPGKRERKIYLDYLQNRHGQTMAAPYCVRPVPGATVSTPLDWSEVEPGLDPHMFTLKNTAARLSQTGDLWQPVLGDGIDMEAALARMSAPHHQQD